VGKESSPPRVVLHVDMDAFFASVEILDDPSLRGKPVVVGGASRRGVVAAASYEARKYGVFSAMPMGEALRKCPSAVVVTPHRHRYEEESAKVFAVFHEFTPLVEGLSVDEAFLDVTASQSLFGDGPTIARKIKDRIFESTKLTGSAGVARSKFVAKIASDMDKPDGLTVVPEDAAAFLAPLAIERMWRIGKRAAPMLRANGVRTLGDLASADPRTIERLLGSWGPVAQDLARGIDDRPVETDGEAKSVSAESTYESDLLTREAIERALLDHASRVAQRLMESEISCHSVVVKIKYSDFSLQTRQMAIEPACDTQSIFQASKELLRRFPLHGRRVRLVGVGVKDLIDGPPPPNLFSRDAVKKKGALEKVTLDIAKRFGREHITHAELLDVDHDERSDRAARSPSVKK
jgi:DNA polymerase-4